MSKILMIHECSFFYHFFFFCFHYYDLMAMEIRRGDGGKVGGDVAQNQASVAVNAVEIKGQA